MKKVAIGLFLYIMSLTMYSQRQAIIDSLNNVLDTTDDLHLKSELYNRLSHNYWRISAEKSVEYADKALALFPLVKDIHHAATANYNKGVAFTYLGKYDSAMAVMEKSVELNIEDGDSASLSKSYGGLGFVYKRLELYDLALKNYLKALNYLPKIGTDVPRAYTLNNVGNIHYSMNNYDLALDFYRHSLQILKRAQDTIGQPAALNNIGNVFKEQGVYDSAEYYYLKSFSLRDKFGDIWGIASCLDNLGDVAYNAENYIQAIEYYRQSLSQMKIAGDKLRIAEINLKMARPLIKTGQYNQAAEFLEKGHKLAKEISSLQTLLQTYETYSDLHEATGNTGLALDYIRKYLTLSDSLNKSNVSSRIAEIQGIYETQKKDREIEFLKKNQEISRLLISKQKNIRNIVIVFSILLLVAAFFLYREYAKKNKAHKQLEQQRNELKRLNDSKDKLFSIISHDLRSPFNSMMGFTEILKEESERMSKQERNEIINHLYKNANDLYILTQNLLNWARSQTGGLELKQQQVKLLDVIMRNLSVLQNQIDSKNIHVSVDVDGSRTVWADEDMLSTVIRNLISNAIKFSDENGPVHILVDSDEQYDKIKIRDEGVGMSEEKLNNIMMGGKVESSKGTRNEAGTGLGLLVCKEFVQMHEGRINIDSKAGEGTTIYILLPKRNLQI